MGKVQTFEVTIKGAAPILMHNGRLADPLDPATKALKVCTLKKPKTDDTHADVARAEFIGSLYHHPVDGLYLPSSMIEAALVDGAKRVKLGKAFKSCVFVDHDAPFTIGGEKKLLTPEQLWNAGIYRDTRGVVIGQKRIMRTRPMFPAGWTAKFSVTLMPDGGVDKAAISEAISVAGLFSGMGDFRPRFGRFTVEAFS